MNHFKLYIKFILISEILCSLLHLSPGFNHLNFTFDLNNVFRLDNNVIHAGDFPFYNHSWYSNSHIDHLRENLLNYCDKNGLVISATNSLTRYVRSGNGTTIDIALLNNTPFHFDVNHISVLPSDHLPIECNIDCNLFLPFLMYLFD